MDKIREFNKSHGYYRADMDVLFIKRLKEFLNKESVNKVLDVMDDICHDCWDSEKPCHCMNDE